MRKSRRLRLPKRHHDAELLGSVKKVPAFVELVYRKRQDPENAWVFRGEADRPDFLTPKIDRRNFYSFRDGKGWSRRKHEDWLLKEYMKCARPHLQTPPANIWEWLALAQHFGLATRLLDWTRNPLAALFFAVEPDSTSDAVVWGLRDCGLDSTVSHADPFTIPKLVMFYPPHVTTRITTQSGCFTAIPDGALEPIAWGADMIRIEVPASARASIRKQLSKFGVTRSSLFPDLDGAAATINWMYSS